MLMLNPKIRIDEWLTPDSSPARQRPIEVQTENGFAIIRLCDVNKFVSIEGTRHYFIVRDPNGYELDITVDISEAVVAEVRRRCRDRITLASSFWINCAERYLTDYLWEQEDYPPDGRITVDELTLEGIDLARRWNCDEEKH